MRQTLRQGALGVAGLLTLFALWWLGVALFGAADGLSARFSPQATLLSLGELLERRELYEHVLRLIYLLHLIHPFPKLQ